MNEPSEDTSVLGMDRGVPGENPIPELLLKKAEWEDALEAILPEHRRKVAGVLICVVLALGFALAALVDEPIWWVGTGIFLLIPMFNIGWVLLTQQEVNRLRRGMAKVEEEIRILEKPDDLPERRTEGEG